MQTTPATNLPQSIEWRLPRHARSVGRARLLFRETAGRWALPADVTDTAELLLSELMTNAYRHAKVPAGREIRARVSLTADRLRVTVTDASSTLPTARSASPEEESGRGLALVEMLAGEWGAQAREGGGVGKSVWFELGITAGTAPSSSERRSCDDEPLHGVRRASDGGSAGGPSPSG
ncbi:ATP-binding protein [Streptomyces sp. NPDC057694]|uniref:ATP-binding protein n=1 Tax=Streptomyces sp. NPDC057694 TaxID=3346216 RepID=UPI003676654A